METDKELKIFNLYRLHFFGVNRSGFSPRFEKIKTPYGEKLCLLWGVRKSAMTYYLYVFPISNPIPVGAIIVGSMIISGLGLSLALLRKIDNMSGKFYTVAGISAIVLLNKSKIFKWLK